MVILTFYVIISESLQKSVFLYLKILGLNIIFFQKLSILNYSVSFSKYGCYIFNYYSKFTKSVFLFVDITIRFVFQKFNILN